MKEPLEEWIKKYSAVEVLMQNLENNLEAMTDLKPDKIKDLMRMNMIMVRQFAEDCGLE